MRGSLSLSLMLALARIPAVGGEGLPQGAQRLTTDDIRHAFSDVLDQALVQDSVGATASRPCRRAVKKMRRIRTVDTRKRRL